MGGIGVWYLQDYPPALPVETYTGLASTTWKARLGVHNSSFTHRKNANHSELGKYIWRLKDDHITYSLSWKILARAQPYNPSTKTCRLCLTEKYFIMYQPEGATLNKRSEFYGACLHKAKVLMMNG